MPKFRVVNSTPEMAGGLESVQEACFPTLAPEERMRAEHYRAHVERFPEGQLAVVTDEGEEVACSTDFRLNMDFDHIEHRYIDIVDGNWLTHHDPQGAWLYGADIGVKPDYRGLGLSTLLYNARHALVRHLNLRGHVAGGMLSGYGQHKEAMTVEDYVERVIAGELFDPTVSIQLKRGFRVRSIIQNYLDDPVCDNKAALIVWENPDYDPSR